MKTDYTINVRCFPVVIRDERTGETRQDTIILDKQRLQAAQLVGESSKELIHRIYNRAGFQVLDIDTPDRREINLNLDELYKLHSVAMLGKREAVV